MPSVCVVIPARFDSSRFPGKPLVDILGNTMIHRVYDQVRQCKMVERIIVATDDQRIADEVLKFGGEVIITSKGLTTGTQRVIEAALEINKKAIVINVQGDEPVIQPEQIDELIEQVFFNNCEIATQCTIITDPGELFDFNVVKVVRDFHNKALYFSRQAIPGFRDLPFREWFKHAQYYKHIGIYAFNVGVLEKIKTSPTGQYSTIEMLEQLAWLQNGIDIYCFETKYQSISIDTPEDVDKVVEFLIGREINRHI